MTDPQVALLMLALLIVVIILGLPMTFTLVAMGLGFGYYAYYDPSRIDSIFDNRIFDLFVNQTYSVMSSDVLPAIPLFLLMGYVIERASIVDRLFSTFYLAAYKVPGAMAVATLLTCALIATATGIVGVVVTLMGLLALPQMLKARYNVGLAAGVICAGGSLGILIPPSIMLIAYAAQTNVSVVKLYAGALLPGLLLVGMYLVYVVARVLINPSLAPRPDEDELAKHSTGQIVWMVTTSFLPLALLIVSVLGAMLFGMATPSEAATVGAIGGLLLAAAYGSLSWDKVRQSVYLTARTSAILCWLFVGSATFASVFSYLGGDAVVKDFVIGLDMTPVQFLILTQVIIFILGWPLEWSEIIIIFVPLCLPLLKHFGIDPLFFGILVALNLQMSFLTPPRAMAAYHLESVSPPHVTIKQIFAGCLPFNFIVLFCMVLLYVFPEIVLWLPSVVYGR